MYAIYLHALVDPAPAWIGSEPTDHDMTRSGRTCIASPRPGQGVNVAIARRLEKKENILFEKGIFQNSPPFSKTFHQLPYYFQVWNSQKRNPYFFQTFHARCEPCIHSGRVDGHSPRPYQIDCVGLVGALDQLVHVQYASPVAVSRTIIRWWLTLSELFLSLSGGRHNISWHHSAPLGRCTSNPTGLRGAGPFAKLLFSPGSFFQHSIAFNFVTKADTAFKFGRRALG